MLPYRITEIRPKSGPLTEVHLSMLHQHCQILSLNLGQRGWLLVDVGDKEFGPHRTSISHIVSILENQENKEMLVETENSFYKLRRENTI